MPLTRAAAERNEAHTLVQFDAKARALDAAQQQVRLMSCCCSCRCCVLLLRFHFQFVVASFDFARPRGSRARPARGGAAGDRISTRERKSCN